MTDEKRRILKMKESGKISAGQAGELLEALSSALAGEGAVAGSGGRLRLRFSEAGLPGEGAYADVPLAWARFLAPLIEGGINERLRGRGLAVDMSKIGAAVESGAPGLVEDMAEAGLRVRVEVCRGGAMFPRENRG